MARRYVDDVISASMVLYYKFIRYEQMNLLVNKEFAGLHPKCINIYIDIYSMVVSLFRFSNVVDILNITSCLVNMAIHYRNYFKKFGVYSNIFLLYSPTMGITNTKYYTMYNEEYRNRMLNNPNVFESVNQNIGLLRIVCQYLPDIYFKYGTVETAVMGYDIMKKLQQNGDESPSIFITTSQYAFQIPAVFPQCVLFIPKKSRLMEEKSYSVDICDCLDNYIKETKNRADFGDTKRKGEWITGYMVLSGIPKRNITTLFGFGEALRILNGIESSYNIITPESVYDYINAKVKTIQTITREDIVNRFKCIDINYQLEEYRILPESKETSYLTQLNNMDELYRLNDKYFKNNSMNLDKL